MRSNDQYGPRIYGPHTAQGTNDVVPIMTVLRDDGRGGQELVVYNDELMATEKLVIGGLPSGLIDIGLTWLPSRQVLAIEINHAFVTAILLEAVENRGILDQGVRFDSIGGTAEFGSIEVRVGGQHQTEASVSASITHEQYDLSFK